MAEHDLDPVTRKDGTEGLPARGYSWPPFEPGHTLSTTHGAYSERAIAERAESVLANLFELVPYLREDPVFVLAVARFGRAEARSQLLGEAIAAKAADKGIIAVGARILEAATAADRLAAKLGDDLGLSPLGKARLKAATAVGELGEASLVAQLASDARRRTDDAKASHVIDTTAVDDDE